MNEWLGIVSQFSSIPYIPGLKMKGTDFAPSLDVHVGG